MKWAWTILASALGFATFARAGGGGGEVVPTSASFKAPDRACWNAGKFNQINAFYIFRDRRVNGFTGIYVDGRGSLKVTLATDDLLFYSSGGKCLSFKPKHVNFVVQGPIDFKPNEAFAGTSDNLPIALQKHIVGPPYQVSWTIPAKEQGTRQMYFVSVYPDLPKWVTDGQLLEMSADRLTQVAFLTEKEKAQIDPNWLRLFPKVIKP